MQKRRSRNKGLDRHKKPRKPMARKLLAGAVKGRQSQPKKKGLMLDAKATAISRLALSQGMVSVSRDGIRSMDPASPYGVGPQGFANLFQFKKLLGNF